MTDKQKYAKLKKILDDVSVYGRSIGKLYFDQSCCAPTDGLEQAGEDIAILGKQIFKLTHSKTYIQLVKELHESSDGLTDIQKKLIEHLYEDYSKTKNLSAKFAFEKDCASAKAYGDWLAAKKGNDYSLFKDTLATVIDFTRKSIELRDEKYPTLYTACIDDTEKGGSEPQLDAFFDSLKARIVPLMKKIVAEGKPIREDFLSRKCPIPVQESFSRYLLNVEGLRESALVLMTTEHPFTTNFGRQDVRVTTHYYEDMFLSNIFSTLHEGGHALFMQNEPDEFYPEHVDNHMSNAMHETISRFYENVIGRSEAFIRFVYPKLVEVAGDILSDVSERELYEGVNIARPSLIRTEADELTYCLHIAIRYELEKAFINGDITVDEIPALWNAKYKEYLGVDVPSDTEGCLQDVHWTMDFGYFPSYALGNAYGVQILRTMEKDFDVFAAVEKGELNKVRDWLKERVFSIASVSTPDEWIRAITGEGLNVKYYLDYLEEKYTKLYELK